MLFYVRKVCLKINDFCFVSEQGYKTFLGLFVCCFEGVMRKVEKDADIKREIECLVSESVNISRCGTCD